MTVAASSTSLVTALNAYAAKVKTRTDKLRGNAGQLLVVTDTEVTGALKATDMVLFNSLITDDTELANAQAQPESFVDIFNYWKRISHQNGKAYYPALPAELNGWQLSGSDILSTINSVSLIGFVSPEQYAGDYVFEIGVKSNNSDDDQMGIIVGYTEVNGVQHAITAGRTIGGHGVKLFTVQLNQQNNLAPGGTIDLGSTSGGLKWGDGVVDDSRTIAAMSGTVGGWSAWELGCKIKASRTGDIITLETTDVGHTGDTLTYLPSATVTIDLNSRPELAKFKTATQIGYYCVSQNSTTFQTFQKPVNPRDIFDTRNGDVWRMVGGVWTNVGKTTDVTGIERNRFYYSRLNSKFMYMSPLGQLFNTQ